MIFSFPLSPILSVFADLLRRYQCPNTFNKIVQDFISLKGLDVNDIELLTAEDGRVRNEMVDKRLEGEFVDFHNKMATLRVISKSANLSIVKRQSNNQNQN